MKSDPIYTARHGISPSGALKIVEEIWTQMSQEHGLWAPRTDTYMSNDKGYNVTLLEDINYKELGL